MLQHSKKGLTVDTNLTGFLAEPTHHGVYSLHLMPKWRGTYPQYRQGMRRRSGRRRMDWVWQSSALHSDIVLRRKLNLVHSQNVRYITNRKQTTLVTTLCACRPDEVLETFAQPHKQSSNPILILFRVYCQPWKTENKCTVWWVCYTVSHIV